MAVIKFEVGNCTTTEIMNNPHDSLIMQAAVEEIFNNITNSCFSECKELNAINDSPANEDEITNDDLVLTIEELKIKARAKSGKSRARRRSNKALEQAMHSVSDNLFADFEANNPVEVLEKPVKAKSKAKKRIKGNINEVCADLFYEYHKGLKLFAA